jgi:acetyl-CoA carboxylase beta subunit
MCSRALDNCLLYFNGGKLHMQNFKTRCGKEVPINKYKTHIESCQQCIENKKLQEKLLDAENEIEENLKLAENYIETELTLDELIKITIEFPSAAKKLQKIYSKYKPKLEKIREKETIKNTVTIASSKLSSIGSKIKNGFGKFKFAIKNLGSKIKSKLKKANGTAKGVIAFMTTVLASYIINYFTGFSFIGLILDAIKLLPGV